jgi:hypothetical protein
MDGLMDLFDFNSYWTALKQKISDLQGLGAKIMQHFQKISMAQQKLIARDGPNVPGVQVLADELNKISDDLQKWSTVKQYLDNWMPKFMEIEKAQNAEKGLGIIPALILGVSGIAALAYCVNVGLALLQDYNFKMNLTQDVIDQKISSGQYKDIVSADTPIGETIFEKVAGNIGMGVGIGIPTVLLVGGGLYLAMQTGLLKGVLDTISGMFKSSAPSSGG